MNTPRIRLAVVIFLAGLSLLPVSAQNANNNARPRLDLPKVINVRVEIWRAARKEVFEVLDKAKGKVDVGKIALNLRERADEGAGAALRLVSVASVTQKSGNRGAVTSGEGEFIADYRVDAGTGTEVPVKETYLTGTRLVSGVVIGPGGKVVDVNVTVEHALSEPKLEERTITGPVSGRERTVYSAFEDRATVKTAVTLLSGQTALLGTLPADREGASLLVFLSVDVVDVER